MQETIELLSDTEAMSSIRQGRKEIQHKDIISWDEVKKEIPLLDNWNLFVIFWEPHMKKYSIFFSSTARKKRSGNESF